MNLFEGHVFVSWVNVASMFTIVGAQNWYRVFMCHAMIDAFIEIFIAVTRSEM